MTPCFPKEKGRQHTCKNGFKKEVELIVKDDIPSPNR